MDCTQDKLTSSDSNGAKVFMHISARMTDVVLVNNLCNLRSTESEKFNILHKLTRSCVKN